MPNEDSWQELCDAVVCYYMCVCAVKNVVALYQYVQYHHQ